MFDPNLTARLREHAVRLTGAVRDKSSNFELYRLPDGSKALMRTNVRRTFVLSTASVVLKDDPGFAHLMFSIPALRETLSGGIEVYLVPVSVVREAITTANARWAATHPDTAPTNPVRRIDFDLRNGNDGCGFATTWAAYRVALVSTLVGNLASQTKPAPQGA